MPGGDGTGPVWAGPGAAGGGGRWCRGAGYGFGGHGWRNVYQATGLPGCLRRGRRREPWLLDRLDIEDERRHLEWHAGELHAELRRIRTRLDALQGERTEDS